MLTSDLTANTQSPAHPGRTAPWPAHIRPPLEPSPEGPTEFGLGIGKRGLRLRNLLVAFLQSRVEIRSRYSQVVFDLMAAGTLLLRLHALITEPADHHE